MHQYDVVLIPNRDELQYDFENSWKIDTKNAHPYDCDRFGRIL